LATEKGYFTLKHALLCGLRENIGCVVSYKDKRVNDDYIQQIMLLCEEYGIAYYNWFQVKDKLSEVVINHGVTGAVTISWQYLIDLQLNALLQDELIVIHDSLLPKYRGFAPTPTAILCGDKEIGISAIFAEEEVDSGNIILQKKMMIKDDDYIKDIITRQSHLYAEVFLELMNMMQTNQLASYPQEHENATYSVWRSVDDCRIDWSKPVSKIYALVRAVSFPYPGAFTFYEGKKIMICRAKLTDKDLKFAIRDHGKIWSIEDGAPVIICGEGMLKITDAVFENGEKVMFEKLRVRLK